jgi:hypothetical protein
MSPLSCTGYLSLFSNIILIIVINRFIINMERNDDRLCGLVVRVPGYTTEMYCASCEVRTEFIYVM